MENDDCAEVRHIGGNMARAIAVVSSTALLLLGFAVPLNARQDQREKPQKQEQQAKPNQQPQRSQQEAATQQDQQRQQTHAEQQAKEQQGQNRQRGQEQDHNKQQPRRAQQQDQNKQQHAQQKDRDKEPQQRAQEQDHNRQLQQRQEEVRRRSDQEQHGYAREHRTVWREHRARDWQSERRDWHQRGGYHGYRIPETHYRGYFGPDHRFHISMYPLQMYGGYPRFQYAGFWFAVMDPWSEYWSDNWYDHDDVYIVYSEDGYYLCNRRYPRDRIAITVYIN